MNQTIIINSTVSIDNAIACIKRGHLDLAVKFLENAKEIISVENIEPESDAVLNMFSQADNEPSEKRFVLVGDIAKY